MAQEGFRLLTTSRNGLRAVGSWTTCLKTTSFLLMLTTSASQSWSPSLNRYLFFWFAATTCATNPLLVWKIPRRSISSISSPGTPSGRGPRISGRSGPASSDLNGSRRLPGSYEKPLPESTSSSPWRISSMLPRSAPVSPLNGALPAVPPPAGGAEAGGLADEVDAGGFSAGLSAGFALVVLAGGCALAGAFCAGAFGCASATQDSARPRARTVAEIRLVARVRRINRVLQGDGYGRSAPLPRCRVCRAAAWAGSPPAPCPSPSCPWPPSCPRAPAPCRRTSWP